MRPPHRAFATYESVKGAFPVVLKGSLHSRRRFFFFGGGEGEKAARFVQGEIKTATNIPTR